MAEEKTLTTTCNTIKEYGCCPLNLNCDKLLTKECWQNCLLPLQEKEWIQAFINGEVEFDLEGLNKETLKRLKQRLGYNGQ